MGIYTQKHRALCTNRYRYTDQNPIIGVGQGSIGGPTSCSTIVFLLLMAIHKLAKEMYVFFPTKTTKYYTKSIMFFDDNTDYNNNFTINLESLQNPQLAVTLLEKDTQHWEILLGSSGGKSKFIKFGYYIML